MKINRYNRFLLMLVVFGLVGCVTSETTVTAPDGTVTHTITKATDASSINAGANAAANAALLLSNLRGGK